MSSEKVSLMPVHPFVQSFVLSIIQNIRARNFEYEERKVVDADLVPRVSERVMMASMGEKALGAPEKINRKRVEVRRRDMSGLVAPLELNVAKRRVVPRNIIPRKDNRQAGMMASTYPIAPANNVVVPNVSQPAAVDMTPVPMQPAEGVVYGKSYGKILPLLNDPSVSSIECLGQGKPVMIIRVGQVQRTKISLNELEIKGILEGVADSAHVPLLEGVFRVVVDGLNVNAVVSGMIGSRFVIKKATAYGLLEN